MALCVGALLASRSKGGMVAFACGAAACAVGAGVRSGGSRRTRAVLVAAAAVAVLAAGIGLAGARDRLRASVGVRLGYWQVSLRMAAERPLTGVGPDGWADRYAMRKEPEHEDARAAHSAHLQVLAETGVVGLLLWCATWAALLVSWMGGPPPDDASPSGAGGRGTAVAMAALAAVALGVDAALLGTLHPPRHVPPWLADAPWLPYALVWCVWTAVFAAGLTAGGEARARGPRVGVAAALVVFLVHSAGDFTVRVPAIGLAAAVLAGLSAAAGRPWAELQLGRRGARAALAAGTLLTAVWALAVARPALEQSRALAAAEDLRLELLSGRPGGGDGPAAVRRLLDEHERACRAVPWDDGPWRERASALLWLAGGVPGGQTGREALDAAGRAVERNPLAAANWTVLAQARRAAGDAEGALDAIVRSAQLQPSLPAAWYPVARAYEQAGRADDAAAAYERMLALLPRQYHPRNRVPGDGDELVRFWAGPTARPGSVTELARAIAVHAGAVGPAADEAETVAALADGLDGGRPLLRDWPALHEPARSERLYRVVGPRLWQWALEEKVRGLRTHPATHGETDGASGGT